MRLSCSPGQPQCMLKLQVYLILASFLPDNSVAPLILVNGADLPERGPVPVIEGLRHEEVIRGLLKHRVIVVIVQDSDHD